MQLNEIIAGIRPPDASTMREAKARLDELIKPIGSLGRIEDLAVQLAGITGQVFGDYSRKATIVFCADNGVYEEGVSAAPQSVTLMQSLNFGKGITGIGVLSKLSGSEVFVVDIGINSDVTSDGIINRKIRKGTSNLAKMPAMTREEALQAIAVGFEQAQSLHAAGYSVLGTGEMGLGNTTTASLVILALTGCTLEEAVGKGAGLSKEAFSRKKQVIQNALAMHHPNPQDPIDVLAKVGGFDIAGMVGAFLGAAYCRMPVVIDGIISAAAALVAQRLCANATHYMVPSHKSDEPGYAPAMRALSLSPYFHLDMRLGEGTGCPFAFLLIDAANRVIRDMATFAETSMDDGALVDIRKEEPDAASATRS